MIKKVFLWLLVSLLLVFLALEWLSYGVDWYSNQVPEGYFDDIGRVVVDDTWYMELLYFSKEEYNDFVEENGIEDFLKWSSTSEYTSDTIEEYILNSKEDIVSLESDYKDILFQFITIVTSYKFGHLELWQKFEDSIGDTVYNSQFLGDHLAHFALLECYEAPWSKMCDAYLSLIEKFLTVIDRRSTLINALVRNNHMKTYNSLLSLLWNDTRDPKRYLCRDVQEYKAYFRQAYKDELNMNLDTKLVLDGVEYENNFHELHPELIEWYYYHAIEEDFLIPFWMYIIVWIHKQAKITYVDESDAGTYITSIIWLTAMAPISIGGTYESIDMYCNQ